MLLRYLWRQLLLLFRQQLFAPDVDAFEDSRAASLAVGNINDFSLVITDNCVEETTAPVTQEITTSAATTQKNN